MPTIIKSGHKEVGDHIIMSWTLIMTPEGIHVKKREKYMEILHPALSIEKSQEGEHRIVATDDIQCGKTLYVSSAPILTILHTTCPNLDFMEKLVKHIVPVLMKLIPNLINEPWMKELTPRDLPLSSFEQLLYKLKCNGFLVQEEVFVLFEKASFFNHSCDPNGLLSVDVPEHSVSVVAIKPIKKSDEVCISYISPPMLEQNKQNRREYIKQMFGFDCRCSKCNLE